MGREILFRAKRKDNDEWVEGNLITNERCPYKKYIGYIFDEAVDSLGILTSQKLFQARSVSIQA